VTADDKAQNLAIVTGGSRGLGEALVLAYEAREWSTFEISRSGVGLSHMSVDLSDLDASFPVLERQFESLAKSGWGRVIFFNNAGVLTPIGPVHSLQDAQIARNLEVNLVSGIRLMSAFVRAFEHSDAELTLVNISSGASSKGYAGWPLYCTAKAGLENFIRSLAAEQAGAARPMTCLNIEPGVVDTDMQAEIRETGADMFPEVSRFIELKKSGKLRSPKSVARAIIDIVESKPQNGARYRIADQA
jgi:NAD(P)-dependent dehydrogenase (short-subunit alcohol dehydrogenase family)